jgi:DNA-directed RNA polymerase specialized sigma24 family protein
LIVDGFAPTEIAALLGKTAPAIRQRLHAARQRLARTVVEQHGAGKCPGRTQSSPREDAL